MEFIVVSFVFILFLAAFNLIGETVLFKIKSLIAVRNLAFNETETGNFSTGEAQRQIILTAQTPSASLDRCLLPYFMTKPSRVRTQVAFKPDSFFKEWIPVPAISDRFLIAEDSWENVPPVVLGTLASRCSG